MIDIAVRTCVPTQFSYWAWIGTMYLLRMMWQDYTNDRKVDIRGNWLMYGISLSVAVLTHKPLIYKLAVAIIISLIYGMLKKIPVFGEADNGSLLWMFGGYAYLSPVHLMTCFILFSMGTGIAYVLKRYVFKRKEPIPFFGVLFVTFLASNILLGLYL